MGAAVPQVVTESSASGAQVIDGSLTFDKASQNHLSRTFALGNRRTWTWSCWTQQHNQTIILPFLSNTTTSNSDTDYNGFFFNADQTLGFNGWNIQFRKTTAKHRDTGWYHIVVAFDTTQGTALDRLKYYVNGVLQTDFASNNAFTQNGQYAFNKAETHHLGRLVNDYADSRFSQVYFIDGQQLDASYFGFTDPLTNTWRPKIFERGTFEELDKFNTDTWGEPQNQLYYQGIKFPTAAGGTVAWKATGSSNTGLNLYTSTDNSTWTRRLSNQTVDSTNGLVYESTYQYVLLVNGSNALWSNQIQLFSDVNGATIHYSNGSYPGNGDPTMSWSGPAFSDGTIASYNSFYLPMDGNSPIGEDKSGVGNNWTPVNFGGSAALDNSQVSGARPILNTGTGGTVARSGVFGSEVGGSYIVDGSSGGSNPYIFTEAGISGTLTKPTFNFIRGATYRFDYSGTDAQSHPLKFSETENGTRAGGNEYTNGRVVDGNVITFTVPHDAPATLWYYCVNHNGMGNSISVTTDESKADKYASNCVLALPLVGSNSDVSDQINCTSTAKVLAKQGNVTASSGQSNFYNGSFYFDGSGDYLGATTNADFAMGTGDFTIECWVYRDSSSAFNNFIGTRGAAGTTAGFTFGAQSNSNGNDIEFYTNGLQLDGGDQRITNDKWHHVAVTRSGTTLSSYVNGILNTTTSNSQDFSNTSLAIGMTNDGSQGPMLGYIQDVRIYKGVAKYSGGSVGDQVFIPASTSPDILPDTPSGVSGSSKLTKITDGAVHFDGASDDLNVPGHSDITFGTGIFTIDCFVYFNSFDDTYPTIMSKYVGNISWILRAKNDGKIVWYSKNSGGVNNESSTTPISLKRWHHIAVVREGTGSNQLKVYVDGNLVKTTTDANDYNDTNDLCIGAQQAGGGNGLNGFISNVRLVKGSALYTTDFTPPTRTLTNVTNTKLLCCQSNTSATAAAVTPGTINDTTISGYRQSSGTWDGSSSATSTSNALGHDVKYWSDLGGDKIIDQVTFDVVASGQSSDSGPNYIIYYTTSSSAGGSSVCNSGCTLTSIPVPTGTSPGTYSVTVTFPSAVTARYVAVTNGKSTAGGTYVYSNVNIKLDVNATNFNPFTTDIDAVRGQETGYTTWNPLDIQGLDAGDLKDGNLSITHSAGDWLAVRANKFVSSGKWYYEVKVGNNQYTSFGVGSIDYKINPTANDWCNVANVYGFYPYNGKVYDAATGRAYATADTSAAGNVYGIAIDMDNKSLRFYENGRDLGVAFDSTTSTNFVNKDSVAPMAWLYNQSGTDEYNFGQKPFKFPPPDGFQSLNAASLRPETVIARPDKFVSTTLYTGNQSVRTISTGNAPDLVWIKDRTDTNGHNHNLIDTVRGAPKILQSDAAAVEITNSPDGLTAFTSNGFTLGANTLGTQSYEINKTGNGYVAWCWKAGGNKNTFNVDDVGYASAADVGMNVGGQNNNAYNQDEIWSNRLTVSGGSGTVNSGSGGFGGTDDNTNSTYVNGANSGTNYTITLTPATPISFNDELIVRVEVTHGDAQLNSGDFVTGSGGFVTFKGPGTFTSITSRDNRGQFSGEFYSVRVDGKLLVDTNVTPPNAPSIPATGCSVGTKPGFSIVKYTGNQTANATVAHGLSQTPDFTIVKQIDNTGESWRVRHAHSGDLTKTLFLNGTAANTSNTEYISGAGAATITLSTGSNGINGNNSYIMYNWHDVPGLQKFGKYFGNGSADGPFVELSFRPAVLIIKCSNNSSNAHWIMMDTKRNTYNVAYNRLMANENWEENKANWGPNTSNSVLDILSNGFKIRTTSTNGINANGDRYVYAAWAEAPAFNLFGAQSNAR